MTAAQRKRLPNRRNAKHQSIQPAKSTSSKGKVFTNCGKADRPKTPVTRTKQKLTRVPFMVSRLMEFCTRRELVNQTGHDVFEWPLVLLKLVDNAIDVAKIIPDRGLLTDVYIGTKRGRRLERAAEELLDKIGTEDCTPPKKLEQRVREILKKSPSMRWDAAVKAIVDAEGGGAR